MNTGTLFLKRSDIRALITLPECITSMELAFKMRAQGKALTPALMHVDSDGGEFHIKGGGLQLGRTYFSLKANGGFFNNRAHLGLPNILGLILLFDGSKGYPLAVMDSIDITLLHTGATTALAARYLARPDSSVVIICGCGNQGRVQLQAILQTFRGINHVYGSDLDPAIAGKFVAEMSQQFKVKVQASNNLSQAALGSDVIITCTPARSFFLRQQDIRPGTFISAVGADSPGKQELEPGLVGKSKLVVDILEQCASVGELQHALAAKLMSLDQVHGELGAVVAGQIPGRTNNEEIKIFDTSGSAIQDTATAVAVYEKAQALGAGEWMDLYA